MSDLKKAVDDLSRRKITRQQFFVIIGGSIFGMVGFFRILQELNTPNDNDLSRTEKGLFGEREYGHGSQKKTSKASKGFSQDTFG